MKRLVIALVVGLGFPGLCAAQMQEICRGSPVPSGWIETNMRWSATECGQGSPSNPNKVVIERFDNKPVGHVMPVCVWTATPNGWVIANTSWVATNGCVPNASPQNPNLKHIRRVQ